MAGEGPRDYDKEFTAPESGSIRRRIGIDVEKGTVTRFVIRLEYLVDPIAGEWVTVVRYDHDSKGSTEATHDITEEGLHIDIFREGEKFESHELTPPLPANEALDVAEDHLAEHLEGYVRRFEQWHGIKPGDR